MIANLAAKKENPVQLLTKKLFVNFIFWSRQISRNFFSKIANSRK
jgi:hypothetical protein